DTAGNIEHIFGPGEAGWQQELVGFGAIRDRSAGSVWLAGLDNSDWIIAADRLVILVNLHGTIGMSDAERLSGGVIGIVGVVARGGAQIVGSIPGSVRCLALDDAFLVSGGERILAGDLNAEQLFEPKFRGGEGADGRVIAGDDAAEIVRGIGGGVEKLGG